MNGILWNIWVFLCGVILGVAAVYAVIVYYFRDSF